MFRCKKCLNEYSKSFDNCPMCGGEIESFVPLEEKQEKQRHEAEIDKRARIDQLVANEIEDLRDRVSKGKNVKLYWSFYISVDSQMELANSVTKLSPFDDSAVKIAGMKGWNVVGVVPKTSGSALQNYEGFGKTWAGGIGGNVVGAYVMMELTVNQENFDEFLDEIDAVVRSAHKVS